MTSNRGSAPLDVIEELIAVYKERDLLRHKVDMLSLSLASRERQLGFTETCAAHGTDYSPTCGACAVSRNIAEYDPAPPEAKSGI